MAYLARVTPNAYTFALLEKHLSVLETDAIVSVAIEARLAYDARDAATTSRLADHRERAVQPRSAALGTSPNPVANSRANRRSTTTRQTRLESGDEGNRTPDPRLAKAVLYQLSYVPWHYQTSAQTAGSGSTELVASIHRSSSACAACMRR